MISKYKHVFFDLDHTLWDFTRNSTEVLITLYKEHELENLEIFSAEDFCKQFHLTNRQLWTTFNQRGLSKESLRSIRFNMILKEFGVEAKELAKKLAEHYLDRCPTMHHVFPYTLEVLHYLKHEKQYQLHILSNGFEDVQYLKLNSAQLTNYFQEVITAEKAGFMKPQKEIFAYAMSITACQPEECIMVGDDLAADIVGARNAEIDQVFFNPGKHAHQETITYEICCLSELFNIL